MLPMVPFESPILSHQPLLEDQQEKEFNVTDGNLHLYPYKKKESLHTESTPSTCCRARYLSRRSFCKDKGIERKSENAQGHIYEAQKLKKYDKIFKCITHSSMTSPSPTIRGPVSSGGFLRVSSAASASANCRLSFSSA